MTELASQEQTHVTALTTTLQQLNVTPVAPCDYNFNVTNPTIFVITAGLIESVSVSSYIGLLSNVTDAALQKVFTSILAVEARHSSFIRAALGDQPFPSPYDTPIDLDEINTLVKLFTVSCPQKDPLALKVLHLSSFPLQERCLTHALIQNYPTLSSSFSNHGVIGREVSFTTYGADIKAGSDSVPLYAAFLTLTGPVFAP